MSRRQSTQGFTLIEAMIVVTAIGILAVIGTVSYQKWIRTAYLAEAHDMVTQMRSAEESFRAETGGYLTVSAALDPPHMYPAATPGAFKTGWGGPCATCTHQWSSLTIEPKGPVAFGYAVVSDDIGTVPSVTVNGVPLDFSGMTAPWYIAQAVGDMNGDSVYTKVYGFSTTNRLVVDHEGE